MFFERRCPGCGDRARFVCDGCWSELVPARGLGVFVYDGLARSIVLAAKNQGRRDLLRPLGRALGQAARLEAGSSAFDLVTWVPASRAQQQERGYDQGRLLAKAVAGRLGCRHRRLLRRVDRSTQTGRSRADRLHGPLLRSSPVVGGRVLLVDDVRTTGASLRSGASALRLAGAESVTSLALAVVE